jgi:DNA (cytosine-5)-methyltransferase 1
VFVVASAREGFDPAKVLFEFEGVRRDTPPSREAGKETAGTLAARTDGGGFPGTDEALSGYLQPITRTHGQGGAEIGFDRGPTLTCNQEEPIVAYGIRTANTSSNGWGIQEEITHTLDGAMGIAVGAIAFDTTQITSAANRSNPQPLVPIAFQAGNLVRGAGSPPNADVFPTLKANHRRGDQHPCVAVAFAIQAGALRTNPASGPDGVGVQADHAYTLEARAEVQAVQHAMQVRRLTPREYERLQGFNGDQSEKTRSMGNVEGQSPTLRRDGPAHVAVAFPIQECHVSRANLKGTGTGLGGEGDPMFTLQSAQPHGVATAMQVRRLTPREYERLQGFPDGYTAIPWRGKPASECPDGPRYKALGNSWAVPVVRWIGERINAALRERLGEGEPR